MNMFSSVLERIPKNRSEFINDLEVPYDVTLSPYVSEDLSYDSSLDLEVAESSESSLALSRAMTDSDIDYESYKTFKSKVLSDPWLLMRGELDAFPQDYLDSLSSFYTPSESSEERRYEREQYNEELKLKMQRFFEEECRVFEPDDPGLCTLERALEELDLKESDSDSSSL